MKEFVIATHNEGKRKEFEEMLSPFGVLIKTAADLNIPEPVEDGNSFAENAMIKAKHSYDFCGIPSLADDSGLCVDALDGAPGIYSARWAGEEKDFNKAMQKINDLLDDNGNRRASFVCCLALYVSEKEQYIYEGKVEGNLIWPPRGKNGFGYDPFFVPEKEKRCFAEMSAEEKHATSHRRRALQKLIDDRFV